MEKRKHLYFLCDRAGTKRNATRFKRDAARFLAEAPIESNDLFDIFETIVKKSQGPAVVIFDEFSYIVEKDDSIPSVFQRIMDERLGGTKMMLILCGSGLSMMERGVLSYKSPLYGRKTEHLKLLELPFVDIGVFYPGSTLDALFPYYSVAGGIPHYLARFSDSRDFRTNTIEEVFSKTGRLYEEVDFLLRREFREPDVYKNILSAMTADCTRVVEIANSSFIAAHNITKYLKTLSSPGIIKKAYSTLDKRKTKPRYYIKDNMVNFWFTFCEPYKTYLEIMMLELPTDYFDKNFNSYAGQRFEEMVREQLLLRSHHFLRPTRSPPVLRGARFATVHPWQVCLRMHLHLHLHL